MDLLSSYFLYSLLCYKYDYQLAKVDILFNNISDVIMSSIDYIFPYKMASIDHGLCYLGYQLKPNCYSVDDWSWLIKKFEKHISYWCYRCWEVE